MLAMTPMGGEVIAEANSTGDKGKRMVLAGGEVIAYLTYRPGGIDTVHFRQTDALGISERVTRSSPENLFGVTINEPNYIDPRHMETDPMGGNVGTVTSYTPVYLPVNSHFPPIEGDSPVYINGQQVRFSLDGVAMSSQVAMAYINSVVIGGANGLSQIMMGQIESINVRKETYHFSWGSSTSEFSVQTTSFSVSHSYMTGVNYANVSIPTFFFRNWAPQQQSGPSEPEQPPPPKSNGNSNPCSLMAGMLETLINNALKDAGGIGAISTHGQIDSVVRLVNAAFTLFYIGKDAPDSSGGFAPAPPFGGVDDFKPEYVDSLHPKSDQTHHFAGYFNAGVLGRNFAAFAHKWGTDYNNPGDRALGNIAYSMGTSLNTKQVLLDNPRGKNQKVVNEKIADRLKRLRGLANRVRNEICDN